MKASLFSLAHARSTFTDDSRISANYLCTRAELTAIIRKAPRATRFVINVRNDAFIVDADGEETGKRFEGSVSTSINLARRDALWSASGMLSATLEERGARIRFYVSERFSGSTLAPKSVITYWLG